MDYEFVDTRTISLFYFKKENLFFYIIKPDVELILDDVVEIFQITKNMAGDLGVYSITDIRRMGFEFTSKEVTNYTAKNPFIKQQLKNAIIIEGIAQKIFGNFYLNVVRPARQTKLFNDYESALKWLGIESKEILNILANYR